VPTTAPTDAGNYNARRQLSWQRLLPRIERLKELRVNQAETTIILGSLEQSYDGTPKSVTVTTSPSCDQYNCLQMQGGTGTDAGDYPVVKAIVNNRNYWARPITQEHGFALHNREANAAIHVDGFTGPYDGAPHGASERPRAWTART